MLTMHVFENAEIDAQHEVIFAQLKSLQEALSDEPQQVGAALGQLRELLVAHFEAEESFMDAHRQKHREILGLLDGCLVPASGETPADSIVKTLIDSVRSHEYQNPRIDW